MVSSAELIKKYGNPSINTAKWEQSNMVLWTVPKELDKAIPALPSRIYIHKVFKVIAQDWFYALADADLAKEITTYDGCWNVRTKRGLSSLSIHAFGMAIDLNASHNPLGLTRDQCIARKLKPFTKEFLNVSRKFVDCGGDWPTRPDLMHFQIKRDAAM